jgi:hypothetical protein
MYICVCMCVRADRTRRQVFAHLYYDAVTGPWKQRLWNVARLQHIQGCIAMFTTEGRVWHFICHGSSCRETEHKILSRYVLCGGGSESDGQFPNYIGVRMCDCRMCKVSLKRQVHLHIYQYWVDGVCYVCS